MAIKFDLVRPDDLLNLRIEAINLRLDVEALELVVENTEAPAYLIFTFPPQTITEQAHFEAAIAPGAPTPIKPEADPKRPDPDAAKTANEPPVLPLPGQSSLSIRDLIFPVAKLGQPSRLVFRVAAAQRIPFTLEGLLDWSQLELSVNPIAAIGPAPTAEQIRNAPAITQPAPHETAIELPYNLIISPTRDVAWAHRTAPLTRRGRTEAWHTRLQLRIKKKNENGEEVLVPVELSRQHKAPLRAIWSPDFNANRAAPVHKDPHLGRTAMSPDDRHQIVLLTSAFRKYAKTLGNVLQLPAEYVPAPFEAEQLMLSPLGGYLRSRGNWTPPLMQLRRGTQNDQGPFDLSEWVHVATQGRDHYVRIVYEGKLLPFHNRAALVKVTERKFKEASNGTIVAYLMQRMFIVVREPEKIFNHISQPFRRVRLTTLVTPDIAEPQMITAPGISTRSFWVEVMTSATLRDMFRFHVIGTDKAGDPVDFTIPMMFVSISDAGPGEFAIAKQEVRNAYNHAGNLPRRDALVPGQKVAFAEPQGNDNTRLVTQALNFVVDVSATNSLPHLLRAQVKLPQVEELLGKNTLTTIRYFKNYVEGGFDPATGVFAEVVKPTLDTYNLADTFVRQPLGIAFSSDKAGGIATPDMSISTLTRRLGPVAGRVEDAVTDKFDPEKFFPKGTARLFGSFDLFELLLATTLGQNAPKMTTERSPDGQKIITKLDWEPEIRSVGIAAIARFEKRDATRLEIHGRIEKSLNTAEPPTFEFKGRLTDFTVGILAGSVVVDFDEFSFVTRAGQKTDVAVKLDPAKPIAFGGDLKFVEELRDAIPPDLFGKGPFIELMDNPPGVRAGFALALPPISVGVFSLRDVSLGAALTLPFLDGKPVFDFNVSERAHPFVLSVAFFGGGGFFHLQLDTAGMKQLEASFEFGATAALDIGVASGEVHIMAGIYFKLQRKDPGNKLVATLTGFLRLGGSMSVLGIVKISVEFILSFTYDGERDKAYGRATLTVEIEILFFSISVELTVERAFGGASGDPVFGQLMNTPEAWEEYALAFA